MFKHKNTITAQASIVLVLLLGLAATFVVIAASSMGVGNVQIESYTAASDQAWYAAQSGIDEVMFRLRSKQDFGSSYTATLTLQSGATVSATITGDSNAKIATATGFYQNTSRRLEVSVASSSSKASFIFAAQSGDGGFELEGNTLVTGKNGESGNVYSNGNVLGAKANAGNAGSRIFGSVWATGYIGGLSAPTTEGPYIQKTAKANALSGCLVGGDVYAPAPPGVKCTYSGTYHLASAPAPVPLASVDAAYWKDQAATGASWTGDCTVLGSGGSDCTAGTAKLGDIKINGNLSVPGGSDFTLTGPVWVVGDIDISQNNQLYTDESAGKDSVVIIASDPSNPAVKGRITTSSNVTFNRNSQGAGLIFISENTGIDCSSSPAISVTSNTATVVFVSQEGCINISSNSVISGVLGRKIHIKNNSTLLYDPSLAQAIVGSDTTGWAVTKIREY